MNILIRLCSIVENMKPFFVIIVYFTVISCCQSATTILRNGDIIEIETIDPNNAKSAYELEKVLQSFGNTKPGTYEIVTNERVPPPYRGQMQYYNNYYNNENRQRPMYRPPPPPDGYAHGQETFPNWNPPPPNGDHQYPPQYNPYNHPHKHHHHQRPYGYGQQNQQSDNNFVLTKHPTNPDYPNFEIYTLDITNDDTKFNNNKYPNVENNQHDNKNNPNANNNRDDISKEYYSDENKPEQIIKDKVDGYIDKFPIILLKENEIRR